MGLEQIREELLQKAEQEASLFRKEAEQQARQIMDTARQKAEQMALEHQSAAQKQIAKERKRLLEAATFEASTSLLKAKKELMDEAIAQAKAQLSSIPAEKRKNHIELLLKKAQQDVDVAHVLCSKKDAPFVHGPKVHDAQISGGLIAENAQRTMRSDLSYDTLFSSVVEESLSDVYTTLFAQGIKAKAAQTEEEQEHPVKKASKSKRVKKT